MTILINISELRLSGETARVFDGFQYGNTNISFFLINAPPGDGPSLHSHPYEEIFIIQEGKITFTVGDATIDATGGQIVIAPAEYPINSSIPASLCFAAINIHPTSRMVTEWLEE